jgi:hypothetical protein
VEVEAEHLEFKLLVAFSYIYLFVDADHTCKVVNFFVAEDQETLKLLRQRDIGALWLDAILELGVSYVDLNTSIIHSRPICRYANGMCDGHG